MNKFAYIFIIIIVLLGGFLYSKDDENNLKEGSVKKDAVSVESTGKTIDLSNKNLEKVPNFIFDSTDTEVLNISNNNLNGSLQAEVRKLSNLRILNLSNNDFTGVPAEVGQLSKLEILDLSNNPITGLPYEIGNLKNLKILDLRGTNYSKQDLDIIKQSLSENTNLLVD